MTVNAIGGIVLSSLSAVAGVTLSTLSEINGQALVSGGGTPSDIAGIWEWWEPSRNGFVDTQNITTMAGQFAPGTGHDFVTSTCGGVPVYSANQLNGLGVAVFDGEDCLAGVDPSALTAFHIFRIVVIDTDSAADTLGKFTTASGGNAPDLYTWVDGHIYAGSGSTTRKDCGNPAADLTSWRCFEEISTSSEWTALLDGASIFTTGTNTVATPSSCVFGANTSRNLLGKQAGVYIFSAKLTGADRAAMVSYLNDRFGLSIV